MKTANSTIKASAALFFGVISLSSCGGSAPPAAHQIIQMDRARTFHSIADLSAAASVVVRITATGDSRVETVDGLPFSVTVARVTETLKGSLVGSTIRLRQVGDPSSTLQGGAPLLQSGRSYVVFVTKFTFENGIDTGQYAVVGGASGLFLERDGVVHKLDKEEASLPDVLPLGTLRAAVQTPQP